MGCIIQDYYSNRTKAEEQLLLIRFSHFCFFYFNIENMPRVKASQTKTIILSINIPTDLGVILRSQDSIHQSLGILVYLTQLDG